jgi:sulfate permease, SulP family
MASPGRNYYKPQAEAFSVKRLFPAFDWIRHYRREQLGGDLLAGVIVAVMLVPQGMAYALLAGLPPQIGLYASIVPLLIYGLLGTSRAMAVGPVAMVSLLVASGINSLAPSGPTEYMLLALSLAFLIGLIQLAMGIFRAGFLVNFLSHPVLSGFSSAAAIVIGFSQLKYLLGFNIPRIEQFHELIAYTVAHISETNFVVLAIASGSIAILLFFKYGLGAILKPLGWPLWIARLAPLVIVLLGTLLVWFFGLQISIVGTVPAGLPPLSLPSLDLDPAQLQALLPTALTISVIAYMESISVAKSLASKRREKVDPNQELIALGIANLGAAFTSGYPVTGGFARSMVNFAAGANTGLASIVTAALMLLTVVFLTPLFYYLPNAVLAAIIVVAVSSLLDWKTVQQTWRYNKADFVSLLVTFIAVLEVNLEAGILIGALTSLGLYLWRTSQPHVVILGRIGETEEYRNIHRHETACHPKIIAMRIDESLYFPNAQYLEHVVLSAIADNPQVEHFVLVASAVNYIDTSALDVLEALVEALNTNEVSFNMAMVKGPVMDRLRCIGFVEKLGEEHFFLTTHQAMTSLARDT